MARREHRAWKRHRGIGIDEARQLLDRRKPPPLATTNILVIAARLSSEPVFAIGVVNTAISVRVPGRLLPDQPSFPIQHRRAAEVRQDNKPGTVGLGGTGERLVPRRW